MKTSFSSFILVAASIAMLSGCASPAMFNPLCQAIIDDDIEKVRMLMKNGADVNDMNCSPASLSFGLGFPPLFKASQSVGVHASEIAKLLIKNGADVKYTNNSSGLLFHAAFADNSETVKLLIRNGADVNQLNDEGYTPLGFARARNKNNAAKTLSANGGKAFSEEERLHYVEGRQQRQEEARREQERQDKAESRATWKGLATLATGVAVGNATKSYSPDQQTRMMKSSMKAVDSGDTSELTNTANQVKAERTQEHNAKMQAIHEQKERDSEKQSDNTSSSRQLRTDRRKASQKEMTDQFVGYVNAGNKEYDRKKAEAKKKEDARQQEQAQKDELALKKEQARLDEEAGIAAEDAKRRAREAEKENDKPILDCNGQVVQKWHKAKCV